VAVTPRRAVERDRPEVPLWALAAALVLCLVFAGLVVQTYAGRSLSDLVAGLLPGSGGGRLAADERQVLYVPGATVELGEVGIGSRGQDRVFQAGDLVLLGAAHKLVRLEEGNRQTEVRADEGTSVTVASLGAWDERADAPGGLTARYLNGAWVVEAATLAPVGAPLHVKGAPEEELTAGFRLVPAPIGRIKRQDSDAGEVIRIRANGRAPSLVLEGWDPLPSLNNVTVTVQATVRASEGAMLELALNDVVDASGTVQKTADRQKAPNEDEWLTLRVQRRVLFASPDDRYAIGIQDVRNRDWFEVRELGIYLGVLP
jgi:hypothetical protein